MRKGSTLHGSLSLSGFLQGSRGKVLSPVPFGSLQIRFSPVPLGNLQIRFSLRFPQVFSRLGSLSGFLR